MLGAALLATFTNAQTPNILKETITITENAEESSTADSSLDDAASTIDPEIPPSPDTPSDQFVFTSDLIIKAVNPGYTVDGTQNVGEFIELQKTTDAPLSLASYSLRYTTSSGKNTTLLNFSEGSSLVGEFLLARLARSPESEKSDLTYMTTLAMGAGTVELIYKDDVVDSICWASKSGTCAIPFKSSSPTTLVRNAQTGAFEHLAEYLPNFDPDSPSLSLPPLSDDEPNASEKPSKPDSSTTSDPDSTETPPGTDLPTTSPPDSDSAEPLSARCYGLEFSEILSYYANDKSEQFIELYNPTDRDIDLSSCRLQYKKKTYTLSGAIQSNSYFAIYPASFSPALSLTKNPSSSNAIDLIDSDNSLVDTLVYLHGQKKSTSYAKFYDSSGAEIWELTYSATPGLENNYQEFRTCEAGKVINPDTGNCVKVSTSTTNTLAECPAGKYRNPLTGRCKNIETGSTEPKPCAEGYERNPTTNRCRKIVAENSGAGYALVPTTSSSKSTFIALGAVVLIVSLGLIYIILQFRREIARAIRKLKQRLHHIGKDLVAWCIRFGRHK